ncbi:MAG: hypothetical protein SV201_06060 [Pseudomonadota bacterium]|nr:hypothetical protein [Pseudomonadota bacterium]
MTKLIVIACLFFVSLGITTAQEEEARTLSGISVVGNKEAPKSLYIVPWKSSEIGIETSLTSGLMDESLRPVDKEVFQRQLDFYDAANRP